MNYLAYKDVLSEIPVSINGNYGDSLQPSQWKDTLSKLESLYNSGHKGNIMIPTKYLMSKEQLETIARNFPTVWIFLAITGLNETKLFSTSEYLQSYLTICSKLENVVCVIRPIVPNKNDNIEILKPIIDTVKIGNRLLTYTGYRDPTLMGSPKFVNETIFTEIEEYCKKNEIEVAQKCSCIIAKKNNSLCHIHHAGPPQNIDFLKDLGYSFTISENSLFLNGYKESSVLSKGDVSFVQMIAKAKTVAKVNDFSEILSLKLKEGEKLVCTSSWFQWATQVPCHIGCWYCFADYKSAVRIDLTSFGCNPQEIFSYLQNEESNKALL